MANLEVQIGADSSEFNSEIVKVEKQLAALKNQQAANIKLGIDTTTIDKQISDTTTKLNGLKNSVSNSANAFNNHSKATANGANTLTQFSRIAQDAPFGIIGIGNNLTATAESFGYLSKSAGGAGGALKAVASSLMGTGGILLAVSLVTTGFTILAQQGLTIGDVFNKLSGNFNQAAQDIKKAYEESSKAALGEVASIKAVISVAQDENISRRERLAAVSELQSKYPAYFGNLTKEQILYGDLSEQIRNVSKALINKAVAEKVSEKAGNAAYRELELNGRLIKAKETLANAERQYLSAAKDPGRGASVEGLSLGIDRAKKSLQGVREELIKNANQIKQYEKILNVTTRTEIKGKANETDVKGQIDATKKAASAKASAEAAAAKKAAKIASDAAKRTNPVITNNLKAADLVGLNDKEFQLAKDRIGRDGELIKSYGQAGQFVKGSLVSAKETVNTETIAMLTALASFNDAATDIINNSISNTFAGLGEAIGSAMSTGGNVLQAAGSALLAGLGGILSDMGKMAIQVGVGMLGIKAALKTLNPYAAIAAGVALVALGSVFSSKSKSIGGSIGGGASGGSSGGGGGSVDQRGSMQTGASVSSPTSSVSGGGSFNNSGGTVVFEIAGQKLIGVLNNTLQGNLRLGGGGLAG